MNRFVYLFAALFSLECIAQDLEIGDQETADEPVAAEEISVAPVAPQPEPIPEKKWYFAIKPGYFYYTTAEMRRFFGDAGGFSCRGEFDYKFWGPFMLWIDGGYFQKEGKSVGGEEDLDIKLATLTLGLKVIHYFNSRFAVYAGAGPRLFMMMLHNGSPYVRSDDNEIGIGGGFDGGFLVYPVSCWPNFFLDLFADYSLKNMKIDEDEVSSYDNDVNQSSVTAGLGIGFRF